MFADDVGASSQPHASPSFRLPPIRGQGQTPRSSANIYSRDLGYRPPEGELDYVTNYQREYAKKSVTPVRQIRNDRMREEPARFEGEPTYNHDYRMWTSQQSPRREKIVRPGAYAPPTGRFQGSSNYTSDYVPHVVTPFRRGQKPGDTSRLTGDEPFDPTTAYRQSYVRYNLPTNGADENGMTYGVSSMRGSARKDVQPPPPLNEISNYQRDYTRKDITKQTSMKPKAVPMMSDEPFDPTTTHKTSFKRWTMEKPYQHQPQQYVRPDGTMESMTTTRLHYDQKPVEKFVARRPANSRDLDALGAFEGTSSYSDQYRGRQQQPEERARPLKRLGVGIGLGGGGMETARFDGQPSYREDYPAHVAHARQIPPRVEESGKELWPTQQQEGVDGGRGEGIGFDSRTVYRDQFVLHPSPERHRREPVTYQPNTTAFDATTNYSVDFTTPDSTGARQASYRPVQGGVMQYENDGEARPRFDGTTSHHVDFQPYNFSKPPEAAAAEPEAEVALSSSAQMNGDAGPVDNAGGPGDVSDGGQESYMAPRFKGHANYGFEYEKWAQQKQDKTSVAAL